MSISDSAERRLLLAQYGRWFWVMRSMPAHAAHWLAGVALPPHERNWLRLVFSDYKEHNVIASRGTSKSFSHSSFAAPLKALLRKGRKLVSVSAVGFRGGKLLMDDSERMVRGQLSSQRLPGPFIHNSIDHTKIIRRDVDRWVMPFKSQSTFMTVPTNNAENLLGIRAHEAYVDERNTFPGVVVQKAIRPWMNVGTDFRKTAGASSSNQIFQVGTIDYTIRDWYPEIQQQRKMAQRQFDAQVALQQQDFKEYTRLMNEDDGALKTWSGSYTRVDYTDLMIPSVITPESEPDAQYEINYPLPKGVEREEMLQWVESWKKWVWMTYPVDVVGLEQPLRDGTMDAAIWRAEQRNCFIEAAGSVYSMELIRRCAETPIYREGQLKDYPNLEDFLSPVMWNCGDPCVIGIDYARESDYFAIVVIRLGELAEVKFDPTMSTFDEHGRPCLGHTTWNNVIWAEAHQKWTAPEAAEKIRELYERYNIIRTPRARGIGLDKQGGGTAVRDALAQPQPAVLANGEVDPEWRMPIRIFDPEDESYAHYALQSKPLEYWGGLELIKATNFDNLDWTGASKGLMQQSKLYLGYFLPPSVWAADRGILNERGEPDKTHPEYARWVPGYDGVRSLKGQLARLQAKTTETGTTRFVMPGDRETEEGKKDLYSAFIYACHMARQHLAGATYQARQVQNVEPVTVDFSGRRHTGDSWYRRLGLS